MRGRITMAGVMGWRVLLKASRPLLCAVVVAVSAAGAGLPAYGQRQGLDAAPDTRPSLLPGWPAPGRPAVARREMIAAAHPLAVKAGLEALRDGGSAADAAVVVQLVLNLVEPQSSGIGGGGFALHWQAASRRLTTYDGRETAPATATPERFLAGEASVRQRPMPLGEAIFSGASVGVPGTLRLLETLHKAHGRLPWARLVQPAVRLAEEGFPVTPRLHRLLRWYGAGSFSAGARRLFFDRGGSARPIGAVLRNPEMAMTLRAIAEGGADAFYAGPIAEAIVAAVREAPNHRGDITLADLAGYRVKEREPVCVSYRGNRICGMGPPSSGGVAVGQVMKLLEPFDLGSGPADAMSPRALHLITEAQRLAFADRNHYIGDPDFVPLPVGLLDAGYLSGRRALIDPARRMAPPGPGTPPQVSLVPGTDRTVEQDGTTHFSIVDGDGNIIAVTSTIEAGFGSRVWAAGFLLNNELTDFAPNPVDGMGRPLANAVGPGRRPRSSMAPTIVFGADGKPWAVLGSPGGSRIILYVVKSLVALIDWKLDAQAAASLMNFGSRGGPLEIEIDHSAALWHALNMKPYGHRISADYLASGAHIIVRRPDGSLEGGADPRREGEARGE